MKKFLAFTLAETLIVMGIIGVISALTLPNLNSSTGDKEKVAELKKLYSNLNDALGRAQAVYGPTDDWYANMSNANDKTKRYAERLTEFMKISKVCGFSTDGSCFKKNSKYLRGNTGESGDLGNNSGFYKIILADGAALAIQGPAAGAVFVDIDGPNKGANTWGKDIFCFDRLNEGEFFPSGWDYKESSAKSLKNYCFKTGEGCANWVIQNENMDYLKADSNGKCPNGTVLSETVTSCK